MSDPMTTAELIAHLHAEVSRGQETIRILRAEIQKQDGRFEAYVQSRLSEHKGLVNSLAVQRDEARKQRDNIAATDAGHWRTLLSLTEAPREDMGRAAVVAAIVNRIADQKRVIREYMTAEEQRKRKVAELAAQVETAEVEKADLQWKLDEQKAKVNSLHGAAKIADAAFAKAVIERDEQVAKLQSDLSGIKGYATAEIEKLTKRIGEIAGERNKAFADLTMLRAEMKQKTDEAVAKADRAEGEYRASRDEVKRLHARLVEVQKDAEADCERKLKALRGDTEFAGAIPGEVEYTKDRIADLEQRVVSLSAAAEAGRGLVARAVENQQDAERKLAGWSKAQRTIDEMHRRAQNAEGAYQRLARLVTGWQKEARAVREWEGQVERDEWTVGVYLTKMQEAFNRVYARLLGCQITTLDDNRFVLVERRADNVIIWGEPPPQSADEAARRLANYFDENNPRYPAPKDAVFLGRFGFEDLYFGKGDIDLIAVGSVETINAWLSEDQAKWREPVKEAYRRALARGLIAATSPAMAPTSPAE